MNGSPIAVEPPTTMLRSSAIVALGIALVSCGALHTSAFLDATKVKVKPEPGHTIEIGSFRVVCGGTTGGSGGCFSTSPPVTTYPLRASLLKTDRRAYRRMEKIRRSCCRGQCL
jgi:hypothetical protein